MPPWVCHEYVCTSVPWKVVSVYTSNFPSHSRKKTSVDLPHIPWRSVRTHAYIRASHLKPIVAVRPAEIARRRFGLSLSAVPISVRSTSRYCPGATQPAADSRQKAGIGDSGALRGCSSDKSRPCPISRDAGHRLRRPGRSPLPVPLEVDSRLKCQAKPARH